MTLAIEADGLGKRYGRHAALSDVELRIPSGRVVGLVGPNGAGKSTLLGLTCGLIEPSEGSIAVLGRRPGSSAEQLARVGFVAQDTPVYGNLTVGEHLRLGAKLNPRWDQGLAEGRIRQTGLDPGRKAGRLSGGQRAQLALTVAAAKRPELLVCDEPVASLDPLARRGFLDTLMEFVTDLDVGVVLSSHLLGDLEKVCDHLVVLADGRVRLTGEADDLVADHYRLTGSREDLAELPDTTEVVKSEHTGGRSTLIVHSPGPVPYGIRAEHPDLEDVILAYLERAANPSAAVSQQSREARP
ncbi:ABC-2 type transport system ATP-binding protein [Streptomyces sp. SAI-135]|uniref:ABC transporter ATP-binding protein n=1 Tax=unclassified Streptomyces TaxID=2593676 RepID=UPI002475BC40|nr:MULTISPECIES: ABC transporter ATP-binding protein [unclassified Streptomyces]MDH6521539.1 ABC-2 type transport system ATP-binding protein [Streptomyces sp. SAI-090]MDH6614363.1 ABC-2 type transport system ATP-binding protein [Streptomyces sp. SAI-135]